MRGATNASVTHEWDIAVSIHAPLARGDPRLELEKLISRRFNPRPSCEGRRTFDADLSSNPAFQSTPLLRGATHQCWTRQSGKKRFNPRPSCEGRLFYGVGIAGSSMFQSTPLLRGATKRGIVHAERIWVSIHAPLARGDACPCRASSSASRFNPRPSCEGRRFAFRSERPPRCFNPRPSCEGRQAVSAAAFKRMEFQSTPLLRGATQGSGGMGGPNMFQSTPLLRGATMVAPRHLSGRRVSIHAPLARGDFVTIPSGMSAKSFNPRPSCEGRQRLLRRSPANAWFQSTPLLRGATV